MNTALSKSKLLLNTRLGKLLLSILMMVLCFPKIDPSFSYGLDSSYWFAINYFFHNNIQFGRDVLFTFGPLEFLEVPVPIGYNVVLAIAFVILTLITFCYTALSLGQIINPKRWVLHLALIFIACQILRLELLFLGIIGTSLLIYNENKKWPFILLAMILGVIGLLIKFYLGASCLSTIYAYCVIDWLSSRNFKKLIGVTLSLIALYFIFWFCIYFNFAGCIRFLVGYIHFAKGYASAMGTHQPNNWWLLGGALIILLMIPLLFKQRKIYLLYGLFFFALFATWKHSYSRIDEPHLAGFYQALILFFCLFIIYVNTIKISQVVLMVLVLVGITANSHLTLNYPLDAKINLRHPGNFIEAVFGYKNLIKKSNTETEKDLQAKKLPDEVLKIIGSQTIDFYPWELTYAAANKLNWVPRPVMQSYTAYTPWLDEQNAAHFSSDKSPQFILWELSSDQWGSHNFGEFDNKYMLNDEPLAVRTILNHYVVIYKSSQFMLLKKSAEENLNSPKIAKTEITSWDTWIKTPETENGILCVKLICKGTTLHFLSNILYKDAEYYLELRLADGALIHYRFIPANAKNGLWISPLFVKEVHLPVAPYPKVEAIRFICSDKSLMQNQIILDWELSTPKKGTYSPFNTDTN